MSDLAELYSRDPLGLTKDDPAIAAMVLALREQRKNFVAAEARGEKPLREAKAKKPQVNIDLAALDLDL